MSDQNTPPGWYPAPGDPPGTQRYWDGSQWIGSPVPVNPSTPPPSPMGAGGPAGLNLASPWLRIAARLIDGLLLAFVAFVVVVAIGPDDFNQFQDFDIAVGLVSLAVGAAYEVGMVAWQGGTVGKLVLGLRVVNQSDRRYPPTVQAAVLRWLPALVGILGIIGSILSLVITIVSLVWLFTDDYRRTVYDRIASTYVVKV